MPPDEIAAGLSRGDAAFHTTHWSVILTACREDGTGGREALANLCATYWPPLYAFIRRGGSSPHDAEDLTQAFFCQFLEREALKHATPARGKFRSFLLACLKQFLAREHERSHAARRGGGRKLLPLDCPESQYSLELADTLTPEALFDRRWAVTVLASTLEDLRQEYVRRQKAELFEDLIGFLPGSQPEASRAELAARHNVSVGAIDVVIHRLRQRFGVLLRQRVSQTVSSEAEIDDELDYLMTVAGSAS